VVDAVVEQVYSGAVTCSRDNTRHQYPEMLSFYLKMHLVAGSTPLPLVGLKVWGGIKGEEGGEKGERHRKTPVSEVPLVQIC